MKKYIIYLRLLFVVLFAAVLFQACDEDDDDPETEPPMADFEGFAPGIRCGDCHDPDQDTTNYVWAKKYQWAESKHAFGGDFERNTSSCAGCHTSEGFIQAMKGQTVTTHIDASPPGCFACHSPHARGDFSLRNQESVVLIETVAGSGDAVFDYGKGNLCAQCHKPRSLSPKPDPLRSAPTDTITITNSRWYPHYGVQSQNLMGTGGFKFAGYNYTGNSPHTDHQGIKSEGCIACHMADAVAGSGIAGGHSMNISYENTSHQQASLTTGCTISGCHTAAGFNIDYVSSSLSHLTGGLGTRSAVEAYMDTLHTLLLDRGWITSEGGINASSSNPLKISPADKAGALFNYFFIEHDLSKGAHNTRYTLELLESSIRELRTP